jgi:hypothetical protein
MKENILKGANIFIRIPVYTKRADGKNRGDGDNNNYSPYLFPPPTRGGGNRRLIYER